MMQHVRKLKILGYLMLIQIFFVNDSSATPATQIWNPSTDVQTLKTFHLGIDNYFSVSDNKDNPVALPTDIGLTYGALKNLEIGIDLLYPTQYPIYFNVKYGVSEENNLPAYAVGIFNVGVKKDVTDYNIFYGVLAKTFKDYGRVSIGYYKGSGKLLVDENGQESNTGLILSWDKALSSKIWAAIDYAGGDSSYGGLSLGTSYSFAPNVSVIFGYTIYNNKKINKNDTFTTQLDINF